jgi:predicted DNA-binding transcriptional regulator YafY
VPVAPELLSQLALACRDHERIRFSYTAANGDETRRLVEPHSLVTAQRSWFLVAWDAGRDDWRTFRVDRIADLFLTRVRVAARDLPTADAAEYLSSSIAAWSGARATQAEVVMELPFAEMTAHFGQWAGDARAVDAERTAWPVGAASAEEVIAALAWVPAGVAFELVSDDATRQAVHEAADRMRRASA